MEAGGMCILSWWQLKKGKAHAEIHPLPDAKHYEAGGALLYKHVDAFVWLQPRTQFQKCLAEICLVFRKVIWGSSQKFKPVWKDSSQVIF